MDGVLVIDKPAGMTSHDVVDVVRKRFRMKKVGHAGTLDPDATGVLIVGLGRATRFLSYAEQVPKSYRAVARFGSTTTTQDASGEVLVTRPAEFTRVQLEEVLVGFRGEISQVPPMVSAVKVGGERLYKKARRGEEVERPARVVTIHELKLVVFADGDPPEATFEVTCSAGTYIRTLVHDIGEVLGSGAHLATLRRTSAGGFTQDDATPLEALSESEVLPLAETVRSLPRIELDDGDASLVANGRALDAARAPDQDGARVALLRAGELVAVYQRAGDRLVADRVVGA